MSRQNITSGAPWESIVGYSRAVKIGNLIEISGTVSQKDGTLYGENDPYLQTKRILEIISEALSEAGASVQDVVRTRMFVKDIRTNWEAIGKAHGEVFKDIKPATSMVEIKDLIADGYLVEIEATAICA